MANDNRFAVLIDADNVSDKYIKFILDELAGDGVITYKRIYGDWTRDTMKSWKNVLLENSITPIQQYSYTTGKNATDSAMIIDAMDILYTGNVDGFCIVSSDSDFTRLASRLREAGMNVIGMGEKKTPAPFIAACNKFKYLEILSPEPVGLPKDHANEPASSSAPDMTQITTLRKAIDVIIDENADDDGWVFMSDIGTILLKRYPDFDVRNYGFTRLTPFIKSLNGYEIKSIRSKDWRIRLVYVRKREQ